MAGSRLPEYILRNIQLYNPVPQEVIDRQNKLRAARQKAQSMFKDYSKAFELNSPPYNYMVDCLSASTHPVTR